MSDAAGAEQERVARRLEELGAQVERAGSGAWLLARLPLPEGALPGLDADELVVATVGAASIKCLEPAPLFQLPLVPIGGVTHASALLARIRQAWAERLDAVRRELSVLESGGGEPTLEHAGACAALGVDVADLASAARFVGAGRIVLPSRGVLSGHPLARAADRSLAFAVSEQGSATDVEIAVTNRLEQLARSAVDRERVERVHAADPAPAARPQSRAPRQGQTLPGQGMRLLLVGPQLWRDAELLAGLRDQAYRVVVARTPDEAVNAFDRSSFDAVLADAELGRLEGLDLIPALSALPGVASLPIVIVDDQRRPARREAAQQVGAAGYLARPIELTRVAEGIARIARGSRGRRYDRLDERLAVRFRAWRDAAFTTQVGRLGCFVQTDQDATPGDRAPVELVVPDWEETLRLDAVVTHRIAPAGSQPAGLGLRFRAFPDCNEPRWIEYLRARE